MDVEFIKMYIPMYLEAAKLTFGIAWIGILLSTAIGFVCCLIRYYNVPILKRIVGVYIELSRNTPLLIQLFFIFWITKARISIRFFDMRGYWINLFGE